MLSPLKHLPRLRKRLGPRPCVGHFAHHRDNRNRLTQVQVSKSQEASKITYLHNALGQTELYSDPSAGSGQAWGSSPVDRVIRPAV